MTAGQLESALIDLINAEGIHAVVDCLADACRVKADEGERHENIRQAWRNAAEILECAEGNISDFIKS